jgi:hypothetical protein
VDDKKPIVTGKEIIEKQKQMISDLQHQAIISQLIIESLQKQLDQVPKEAGVE